MVVAKCIYIKKVVVLHFPSAQKTVSLFPFSGFGGRWRGAEAGGTDLDRPVQPPFEAPERREVLSQ